MAAVFPDKNVDIAYHLACTFGIVKKNPDGKSALETSLFRLCTLAKEGGKSGYAFNVVENGASENDGTLIDGATPYWNIFSRNSTGEWKLSESSTGNVIFRLKRSVIASRYESSLGEFASYNHLARGVGHIMLNETATQYEGTANKKEIRFFPTIVLGDIDWRITNIRGNIRATHVAAVIEGGEYGGVLYESEKVALTGQSGITFDQMSFEIDTSQVRQYSYPTRIRLYVNDAPYGYLPGEGSVDVTITAEPIAGELYVEINSLRNIYTLSGNLKKSAGGSIYGTFRYNAVFDENPVIERQLTKIFYQLINRSDGSVAKTLTVTSGFNNNELPKRLYRQETQFNADTLRLSPLSTQYVRAVMYYE